MKIEVELAPLQNALDIITKLAPPSSGNVTFTSNGKKVSLWAVADLSRATCVVPCSVDREGEFAIPLQALRDAIKGRDNLTLLFKNAVLTVTSGKYKAELSTVDVLPADPLDEEEATEWKLGEDQSAWLKKALRDVALKPTTLLSSWMPVGVKLTDKGAFVACYDTQHMSWAQSKEVKGNFECVLPLETMTNVIDIFHKIPFVIKQTRSRIEVKSKLFEVKLNTPTLEDLPSLADVQAKIREAAKIDSSTFQFNKAAFMTFLDNARAVIGKERAEVVIAGGKGVNVSIRTGQGQVAAALAGQGKGEFKIDYEYLLECVSRAGDEVQLNVVQGAFASMKLPASSTIIALNQ